MDDRIDFLRKKHCEDCDDAPTVFKASTCTRCKTIHDLTQKYNKLVDSRNAAKENLDRLLAKHNGTTTPKPVAVAPAIEQPKHDSSLVGYFQQLSTECNRIISTHRFDFLISVRKNADSLASILKNKPEGEIEIPGTLCYRLDNLIKLLHTLSAEADDIRQVYFEDAKTASNALADEMQQTIAAINKLVPGVDTNTPQMLLNKITLTKETNHV